MADEHVVRLREDAEGWREVDGPRLSPEDPFLTGLDEQRAEALVRSNWALEHASADDAEAFYPAAEEEAAEADEADADGTAEPEDDGVDEWANWNEEDWLDLDYRQRAEDVQAGRVDEHLDTIADVETSDTVAEAVEARRDELEA